MAKTETAAEPASVVAPVKRKRPPRRGPNEPPLLYPDEPTSIPKERIEAAVEKVLAQLELEYED
jgi:hypothetical protein